MHKITFTPTICQPSEPDPASGERVAPAYTGTVTIRVPTYDERLDLFELVDTAAGVKSMRNMARKAVDYVQNIAITRVEDGYQFTTWEDLSYDTDMGRVIMEICERLVGKYNVGKPSAPS